MIALRFRISSKEVNDERKTSPGRRLPGAKEPDTTQQAASGRAIIVGARQTEVVGVPNATFGVPNAAFGVPNAAFGVPNAAFGVPNAAFGVPNVAFGVPNVAFGVPNVAFGVSNAAFGVPNTTFGVPNVTFGVPNATFGVPNVAHWSPRPRFGDAPTMIRKFARVAAAKNAGATGEDGAAPRHRAASDK